MAAEQSTDFRTVLRCNSNLLARCLVVSPKLLFELKSVDYMRDKVQREQSTSNLKVGELLNILDEVPDSQQQSVYCALVAALRQDGQDHVANIFLPSTTAMPMSDGHYELLIEQWEALRQFINPTYALMDQLVRGGLWTQSQLENIMSRPSYSEMSLELLNILLRKPDSAFGKFVDALKATDQQHTAYILTGEGDERPLSRLRRKVLIKARSCLVVRKFEVIHSTLVDELMSTGVLNEVDMLHLESKQTSEEKIRVLFDAIVRKSQFAYDKFIQAFKHKNIDQTHIARLLEGLELERLLEPNFKDDEQNKDRSEIVQEVIDEIKAMIRGDGHRDQELTLFMEENGFAVSEITEGSVRIRFSCFTEESLENLRRLYTDKILDRLFSEAFCPQFAEQGLDSLVLNIAENEFQKLTDAFRQMENDSQIDDAPQQFTTAPVELLELVLMRSFVSLFTDYCKSRYKTHEAIPLAYCTLTAVCYDWWQTMNGWPQSPTPHWFKHKARRAVKFVCRPYVVSPRLQSSLSVSSVWGVIVCDNKLFVLCLNSIVVFGPNNKQQTDIELQQLISPRDIVSCTESQQLFVAGVSRDCTHCVWRVSLDGRQVVKWLPNNSTTTAAAAQFRPNTLSMTSRRLLVTSLANNELLLYGADGVELKSVPLPDTMTSLTHDVETLRGTYIVSHLGPQPRVCEVNVDGHVTRVYCDQLQLSFPVYLSLDSDGRIFVADNYKHRVLLLNSETLELERVLLDTQQHQLTLDPRRLCYTHTQRTQQQLAVGGCGCVQMFTL